MIGKHKTIKKQGDSTFSAQWSGVTFAPECRKGKCLDCNGCLHHEGGSHYCPHCDDFKSKPLHCYYG